MAADERLLGRGKIKDAERDARIIRRDRCEFREGRVHGEASTGDLFLRDSPAAHRFERDLIADEKMIGWRAEPRRVDLDGVGDDGENDQTVAGFREISFQEIGVNRVCAGDSMGLEFTDEPF